MDKNIFIIIEGPDGSGKTSIAKALAKKLNLVHYKRTTDLSTDKSKTHEIEYYENIGRRLSSKIKKELKKKSIVIDRYLYSIPAITYALTGKKKNIITDALKPDYTIYCYANRKTITKRMADRLNVGQEMSIIEADKNKYKKLCKRYRQLFKKEKNIIKINTSRKTVEQSVNKIIKSIKINR